MTKIYNDFDGDEKNDDGDNDDDDDRDDFDCTLNHPPTDKSTSSSAEHAYAIY